MMEPSPSNTMPPVPPVPQTDVLVVDDRSEVRLLIRTMLGNGLHIAEACNGTQAWELVQSLRPRVVLLDVMLPGAMNGLQVLSCIRQNPLTAATKVVMVTGRNRIDDLNNARRHDADGYLTKPFGIQDIQTVVQTFLC